MSTATEVQYRIQASLEFSAAAHDEFSRSLCRMYRRTLRVMAGHHLPKRLRKSTNNAPSEQPK